MTTEADLLDAVRALIRDLGPDCVTFAPVSARLAEMLQEHPGMIVNLHLRWRDDGLVDLIVEDAA